MVVMFRKVQNGSTDGSVETECGELSEDIDPSEWLEDGVCVKCGKPDCDGSCKCEKCGSQNCIGDCDEDEANPAEEFLDPNINISGCGNGNETNATIPLPV